MNYLTIKETALRWGVSERTVNALCTAGRVPGAQKFAGAWAIPADVPKPMDPRKQRKRTAGQGKPEPIAAEKQPHLAMPLLNTPFQPGEAKRAAESMPDPDSRNIALAEYYYFSGQAEKASAKAEPYLTHGDIALRVSACWLFAYANLALNRIPQTERAMVVLRQLEAAVDEATPVQEQAVIRCCAIGASVLLHLPLPKRLTDLNAHIHRMPPGLRLFVLYIEAHHAYLNRQYGVAIGIAETALALEGQMYPIPTVYLHLVASMGYINMNHLQEAKAHLLEAWQIAQPDDLIEPFGEHHGLLAGTLEATIKKAYPDDFKRMIEITYPFSAGWRKIHNAATGNSVADNLTTTEFAASMLAARGWTNQEIAAHMGLSEYTIRHYLSIAMQKLNVTQRTELAAYMLK